MKRTVQIVLGLAIGLAALWLLFGDTQWNEVGKAVRGIDLAWFLTAQCIMWVSFPIRVQRWTYIVRATHPATFLSMFHATQIGFLANFTLPARLGEPIRAAVLSRLTKIEFSKSLALVALDRVTDLFGLIAVMLVAIAAYRPTENVVIPAATFGRENDIVFPAVLYRGGAWGVGIFLAAILGTFVLLYLNRSFILRISDKSLEILSRIVRLLCRPITGLLRISNEPLNAFLKRFAAWIHAALDHFADGLDVFRSPADMTKSIAFSLVTWGMGILYFVAMMKAFHFDLPWYTPFVMEAMLAIAVGLPGPPGFVGQYHLPLVLTLVMIDSQADINSAKAFAIVTHLANYPALITFGLWGLLTARGESPPTAAPEDAKRT